MSGRTMQTMHTVHTAQTAQGVDWIGRHSALHAHGVEAARIGHLWWLMFWVASAVFLLVMMALALAVTRRPQASGLPGPLPPAARLRRHRVVAGAVVLTALTLLVLLVASISTGRAVASLGDGTPEAAAVIEVTGHQWWWEVRYQDPRPDRSDRTLTTANEIHIPAGRPVLLRLASADVIHSFWVPSLHGKRDLIPGHDSSLWIEADRPGVYRGFCAEFCGHQHAHMGLLVIADPPERYAAWYAGQLQTPPPPADPLAQRGRQVVEAAPCAVCHTIQGTQASGSLGPDLSHLASRRTLAAATLPNTPANLAGWIADPQGIKPGNQMPANPLAAADRQAVLAYLESLR
jgi:cytochrome c oxidase subunit 2